jgi:hypothetical protein
LLPHTAPVPSHRESIDDQGPAGRPGDLDAVNRTNLLFLIIGALVIVVAVLGYELYQDRKQPEGMQINVGPNGLSIEKK